MADVPEYKRANRIEPGSPVQGFEQAYSNLGAATRDIGTFGNQLARNSAIEQATIDGVKAGQKPGRKLIPAFTESDKAFTEAYKREEYNTVARDVDQYLSKSYFEVAKNPTAESLELYRKNALLQIDKLTDQVSEENRPKLKRDLTSTYEAKFYQLAGALEDKNNKNLKLNFNLNNEQSDKNIQTFAASGNLEKAREELEKSIEDIRSQIGTESVPTAEYAETLIRQKRVAASIAQEQGKLLEAQKEQKDPEFWAERAELPPTPDNLEANAVLLKQQNMYNNMIGMQSTIARNEGIEKAIKGELTDASRIDYESKMDAMDKSKFQLEVARINLKGIESTQKVEFVKQNANNDAALATVGGDALDATLASDVKSYTQLNGKPPSFEEIANLAKNYEAPIPSFNKQLGAMINSRNPANAVQGANVYNSLASKYPKSIDGIDSKTAAKATLVFDGVTKGDDPIEAVKYANGQVEGLRASDIEDRKKLFKEESKTRDLNSPSMQHKQIAKWMNFDKDTIPSSLYVDFMKNMESAYTLTNNWDLALEKAKQDTGRAYKETNVNGFKQVMWLPPQVTLPYDGNEVYLKNLLIEKTQSMFAKQVALPENQFGYKYEFGEEQINPEANLLYESKQQTERVEKILGKVKEKGVELTEEIRKDVRKRHTSDKGPIRVTRVDADGHKVKGQLYLAPDSKTQFPAPGESPSYGLYFLQDTKSIPQPIYNPDNVGEVARFTMDEADIKRANSIRAQRDEMISTNVQYWKSVNAQVRQIREHYGETENE